MGIKRIKFSLNSPEDLFKEKKINMTNIKTISQEPINNQIIYKTLETVEIDFSNTMVSNGSIFSSFINDVMSNNQIISFTAQSASPRSQGAVDNSDYGSLTYGITPVYNYYAPQYEELVSDFFDKQLINIYVSSKNGTNDSTANFRHFSNTSITRDTFLKCKQRNTVSYLPILLGLSESPQIMYPQGYNFLDVAPYEKKFPFGIDISVGVDNVNKKFKTFLKKANLYETFVKGYFLSEKRNLSIDTKFNIEGTGETRGTVNILSLDMLQLNLNSFLALPSSPSEAYFSSKPSSIQGMALKTALLSGFMRQLTLEEGKSFAETVTGAKNYYEPIFYKIEKTRGTTAGQVLQTYVIPADDKNIIKYFDSQVIANQTYSYRITECALVLGNKFSSLSETQFDLDNKVRFNVEIEPAIYLIEIPMIQDSVMTMSNAPLRPNVDFYTKNNFENIIYMRMYTSGVGQVIDNYYPITPSDNDNIDKLRYKNRFFDQYVFENKHNIIQSYEVMRLSEKPNKLEDFDKGTHYLIRDKVVFGSVTVSAAIRPNQKYYYLCRSSNQYGVKSNHSVIYEVELEKGASTSRLKINTYSFNTEDKNYHFRKMSNLMQITPASQHTMYPSLAENLTYKNSLDNYALGSAGSPIWGEKFKIRVTSDNTGRKIDFNLHFNLIKKKTNEEIK